MSPEKLWEKYYKGDPKSDIYAFGIMFYEMIIQKHPYINV